MSIKTAYSEKRSHKDAVKEIHQQLGAGPFSLILVFASSSYDQSGLCETLQSEFSGTTIAGCSTSGELISGQMLKNSVVVMAFSDSLIKDHCVINLEKISQSGDLTALVEKVEQHFGEAFATMDVASYVGIILIDGLRGAEERLMDRIGDLSNVPFIGGSAGDDLKFETTYVYADGKAHTDAAVVILIKPAVDYSILKTQSFKCLDKHLTVTKANENSREVIEFNNKPATKAYAEAIGCSEDNIADYFMKNPVGLMVGEEPFVRSPMKVIGTSIVFYCNVLEGMELALLESDDIVAQTQKDLNAAKAKIGTISGIINFHCILRTLELESLNKTKEYGMVFNDYPTVGFSTYGEEYIGHINQTSTMLIFADN